MHIGRSVGSAAARVREHTTAAAPPRDAMNSRLGYGRRQLLWFVVTRSLPVGVSCSTISTCACACFISMIWSSRERNRSCSLVSRRSRGRIANPPLHQLEREESRLAIRRNPQNRICKEVALQRPKTGKFGYLSVHNHPAHSMAFEFFTDDCIDLFIASAPATDEDAAGTPTPATTLKPRQRLRSIRKRKKLRRPPRFLAVRRQHS